MDLDLSILAKLALALSLFFGLLALAAASVWRAAESALALLCIIGAFVLLILIILDTFQVWPNV